MHESSCSHVKEETGARETRDVRRITWLLVPSPFLPLSPAPHPLPLSHSQAYHFFIYSRSTPTFWTLIYKWTRARSQQAALQINDNSLQYNCEKTKCFYLSRKKTYELYSSLHGKQYMENKCSVSCFALPGHLVQISFYNFTYKTTTTECSSVYE